MDRKDKQLLKNKAIGEVKKGKSIRETAKKRNIPLMTLHHWCTKAGVKSKHIRPPIKTTDKQIIQTIKKNKVMTNKQLEKQLGYNTNTLRNRLSRLIKENKIKHFSLSGGSKLSTFFIGYIECRLYYVSKKDLHKWIKSKLPLPEKLPQLLKKSITQKLHASGIDFEFEKHNKRAIAMDEELYDKLKAKADERDISVMDLLREASS